MVSLPNNFLTFCLKGIGQAILGNFSTDQKVIEFKWYYDQKISSFFSSDFEREFAYHLTGKILSFEFYPRAVCFECKF